MKIFTKKEKEIKYKYTDDLIDPENTTVKEIYNNLTRIFPNAKIFFKQERSHDYKLDCKYIGIYIDNRWMSVQKNEMLSWNMTWIDIKSKLNMMKTELDCPDLFIGSAFTERQFEM